MKPGLLALRAALANPAWAFESAQVDQLLVARKYEEAFQILGEELAPENLAYRCLALNPPLRFQQSIQRRIRYLAIHYPPLTQKAFALKAQPL